MRCEKCGFELPDDFPEQLVEDEGTFRPERRCAPCTRPIMHREGPMTP